MFGLLEVVAGLDRIKVYQHHKTNIGIIGSKRKSFLEPRQCLLEVPQVLCAFECLSVHVCVSVCLTVSVSVGVSVSVCVCTYTVGKAQVDVVGLAVV